MSRRSSAATGYISWPRWRRAGPVANVRRSFFVRQRAQLIAHIQNTNSQYNLPPFSKKLTYKGNRSAEIAQRFEHPSTQLSIAADLELSDSYDLVSDNALSLTGRGW